MAAAWLLEQGHGVYIPFGHSPDVDLVAEIDGRLVRVQVKSCRRRFHKRWQVQLCTRGGNQSWNGTVKLMDSSRCDYLFVAVADGRRWFIPSVAIGGGTAINLGGPKYAEYEVEPGPRMPLSDGLEVAL
jgi:PD-(D/E)XK endonuclease